VQATTRSVEIGGLSFAYDEQVLAPRPWTEAQSAWARDLIDEVPEGPVLELCSGAGHIGLLALLGNGRSLVMVDANEAACEFARLNALSAALAARVEIRVGRMEDAVREGEVFPLVIADPPWVLTQDVGRFPDDPVTAIDGGSDGLGPTRSCIEIIGRHLDEAGSALLQVGSTAHVDGVRGWLQATPALRLALGEVRTFDDRGVLVLLRRPGGVAC
jgi:release factor glutamine methyltransferase